ncbi:MAG: GNAT family N-acetyltransferase [Promethearchaeota archaeon]
MNKTTFERITPDFQFTEYHFDCGIEELNHFFYDKAKDFIREDYSQLYLSRVKESSEILGYFTLSCTNIRSEEKELASIGKIARYIPGILVGIFAVDKKYQNKGVGTDLMRKAIYLSLKTSLTVGCRCLIVDSHINEQLIRFYQKIGFEFVNKALGFDILQKLQERLKVKRNTIKLYLDFHKIRKTIES